MHERLKIKQGIVLFSDQVLFPIFKRHWSITAVFSRVEQCGAALLTLCGGGPEAGRQTQHQTPKQGQAAPFRSRPHSWMSKSSQIL